MGLVHGNTEDKYNQTQATEFLLLGLLHFSNLKFMVFVVLLAMFLMTLIGNSLIITAIRVDPHLHTPMYFFLANLSFVEMCYTSITLPNILVDIIKDTCVISFTGCMAQVCLFTLCANVECILLSAMALDRYVAICRPLHYKIFVNKIVCLNLAGLAWLSGVFNSTIHTILTSRLPFCGANALDRLYCEVQPLIRLSCADTKLNDILTTISAAVFGVGCLVFILASYVFIISAILRIPSTDSRQKAFSTCTSHITVVVLYYGALIFMYLLPKSSSSQKLDIAVSMIYSSITPVLNPIIYSLRNQQVKAALVKALKDNLFTNQLLCKNG